MRTKYLLIAVCLAAALFALSGCGAKETGSRDNLVVIANAFPPTLDPVMINAAASAEIYMQIYDTLFAQDFETLVPYPSLVESYRFEQDDAGNTTRLRLVLKRGVLFHNGEELKASDVKFSLDRAAASQHVSHIAGSIEGVDVLGEYEVMIRMVAPFAPILNNLAHPTMSIVNEKAVTEAGSSYAQNPVGTGPMRLERMVVGYSIELTRFDGYRGPAPRIKDITIRYIADQATAFLELETGGADILINVMPQDIRRVQADPNLRLAGSADLRLNYLGFNARKPPFDDPRVRRAISHAVDTDALVQAVFQGVGNTGTAPLSRTVWSSAAGTLPQYEYDPELARRLLAEAGFPDGFSTHIYSTNDRPDVRDTAVVVQGMLAEVGIDADIQVFEWATYLDLTAEGEHDMFLLGWTTVTGDPDYGLEIFHSRSFGPGGNRTFWANPEVDRLLDAGRSEIDVDRREAIYLEAQRLIHAEAPIIYTQEGEVTVGLRANVKGFTVDPARHHPYWNVWFE